MLKSTHSPIRRFVIPMIVAIGACMGATTASHADSEQYIGTYNSTAACNAAGQALLRTGRFKSYTCTPVNKRLSEGSRVIDRNLKEVGIVVPKGWQRNHLIPDAIVRRNQLMIEARKRNLYDLDRSSNILAMPGVPATRKERPDLIGHYGSHPQYNALIDNELERASDELVRRYGSLNNVPDPVLEEVLEKIETRARTRILRNQIPTRFDPNTGTKILSDTDLLDQELVG